MKGLLTADPAAHPYANVTAPIHDKNKDAA